MFKSHLVLSLLIHLQNYIKAQAHDHPKFRDYAARYGQVMHQVNMRMAVTLLKDKVAEQRAKERAEAPTVKTEEQTRADEAAKEKRLAKEKAEKVEASKSVWKRRFRPLPESKAVDLFADVIGDAFILFVAGGLIIYEYVKQASKPDANAERITELNQKLEELNKRETELEEVEKEQQRRVETLEQALEALKKNASTKGKKTASS